MIKIGIDVDGVLRNTIEKVNEVFKKHHPDSVIGDIAYNYNFPHINMPLEQKMSIIFNEYPKEIFLNAEPYKEAYDDFLNFISWADENNAKLVCATSQEKHLIGLTFSWLAKHNFPFEELHITSKKGEIGLDYLIDDSPHNFSEWVKNGNPEQNFILMDRDWNRKVEAPNRIKRISEAMEIIKNIERKSKLVEMRKAYARLIEKDKIFFENFIIRSAEERKINVEKRKLQLFQELLNTGLYTVEFLEKIIKA